MSDEMTAFTLCLQARVPVFLWGEPGTGKTSATESVVEAMREELWTLILSIRDPSDQAGIPVLRDGAMWLAPPRWAMELRERGKGVVYLDELNTAVPTTQSSALRVVNEGWAGDCKLPKETSWAAAGNPPETNVGVYNLTPAMANRLCHIRFPLDLQDWYAGMIGGWPKPSVTHLPEDWEEGIAEEQARIGAFVHQRGGVASDGSSLLHAKPSNPVAAGRAWPSPRTWSMAARLKAAAKAAGFAERGSIQRILVEGCVGAAASKEFFEWLVNQDLRDPEEYMSDPHNTPLPGRQDQMLTTLSAVAAAALKPRYAIGNVVSRHRAAWTVMSRVYDRFPDLIIPASRVLMGQMPSEMLDDPPEVVVKLGELLAKHDISFRR